MAAERAPKPYKRDSSGVAPASPQVADRALLERAGSREPADRGGVDGIGPRHIGLRLACSKALERFLALMGRHLARASEANAALLGSLAALAGPGGRGPKMRPAFFGRARGRKFPPGADGASSCAGVRSERRAPWLACGPRRSWGARAENAANFFRWAANAPFEQGAVGDL